MQRLRKPTVQVLNVTKLKFDSMTLNKDRTKKFTKNFMQRSLKLKKTLTFSLIALRTLTGPPFQIILTFQ